MKIGQVFPHSLSIYQSHAEPLNPMSSPSCEFDLAESSFSSTIFRDMLPPTISPFRTLINHFSTAGLRNLDFPQVLHAVEPLASLGSPALAEIKGFWSLWEGHRRLTVGCWITINVDGHTAHVLLFLQACACCLLMHVSKWLAHVLAMNIPQGKIPIQSTFARTRKVYKANVPRIWM